MRPPTRAERDGDLERAAKLRYGQLPELEQQLDQASEALKQHQDEHGVILSEEVGEEDIARSVSRWTGIPVTRLMEGEKEKLLLRWRTVSSNGSSARTMP